MNAWPTSDPSQTVERRVAALVADVKARAPANATEESAIIIAFERSCLMVEHSVGGMQAIADYGMLRKVIEQRMTNPERREQ